MLWYKSFRELFMVLLAGIGGMAIACIGIVYYQHSYRATADEPLTYIAYIYKAVYNSLGRDIFVLLSILLGAGGLLQERAQGTSGFTLALPVSRRRLVFTRALVGYLGVLAIAAVPIVVPFASRYAGETYPLAQSLSFFVLWAGCGTIFYGFTFLLAHRFEGDYLAVLISVPSLMLYGALLGLPWLSSLRMLNIFDILNGDDMPFFDEARHLLIGPLPWTALAGMLLVSAIFITLAARRMEPLDF